MLIGFYNHFKNFNLLSKNNIKIVKKIIGIAAKNKRTKKLLIPVYLTDTSEIIIIAVPIKNNKKLKSYDNYNCL